MVRLLIITLLLTGCATDHRRAHVAAVRDLTQKGYDLTCIDLFTEIKTVGSRKEIPGHNIGYYDPETDVIFLRENCPDYVAVHEFEHLFLKRLGISIGKHHGIINN